MARPRKNLNEHPPEYIAENHLKEDPEGLPPCESMSNEGKIVIAKYVPEMRKVQFVNGRDPGQELMFHYHSKTHPLKHYTLYHGKEYDLPVEIIEHLENCAERQYGYRQGPNGHPEMYVKGYKYIFQCKSVKKAA
jgi:hypothetical protein